MSIRLRLTLWYSSLLALALSLFGGFLFFFMNYTLHSELDTAIAARAKEVVGGIISHSAPSLDLFAAPDIFVQVVDIAPGNVPILARRSTNLGTTGVQLPIPATVPQSGRYDTESVQGERLRIYTVPVFTGGGQLIFLVQVGRRLAPIEETLQRLRLLLLTSGAGVLALAGMLGWWLQGRTLAPIARITAAARDIGDSGDLSQRVPHAGPPDELGQLATTFNAMLENLEASRRSQLEAYNAQRRFVADASHELRTPLTIIRGNLDLLGRSLAHAGSDVREALADMASEAERMSRLVSDLLTLARADAGVHLDMSPVVLGPVLEEAARRAQRLAADKGVSFRTDLEPALALAVRGSGEHLVRLFSILLDNAVKYTPAGGSVRFAAQAAEGGVRIAVSDTGAGIPAEHLPHIFERFYRGGKPQAEGSGLGLAIARWISEEHNGHISAVSQPGQGSSFAVWLPTL